MCFVDGQVGQFICFCLSVFQPGSSWQRCVAVLHPNANRQRCSVWQEVSASINKQPDRGAAFVHAPQRTCSRLFPPLFYLQPDCTSVYQNVPSEPRDSSGIGRVQPALLPLLRSHGERPVQRHCGKERVQQPLSQM